MFPDRDVPLPVFDHLGIHLHDEGADTGERLASPVLQLRDPRVEKLIEGSAFGRALVHLVSNPGRSRHAERRA